MILTRGLEKGNLDVGPGNLNFGYLRDLVSWWRLDRVNPPDIGWLQQGADMTGVNLTAADIQAGMRDGELSVGLTAAGSQYWRRAEANWRSVDEGGTITAWIKRDAIGALHAIWSSSDEDTTDFEVAFYVLATNQLAFVIRIGGVNTQQIRGDTVLAADVWYYVAVTWDGSTLALYVNGEPEELTVLAGANNGQGLADVANRDNIIVGGVRRSDLLWLFDGSILDPRYWGAALTAKDIADDYHASRVWEI